jgi:hypothetical protein
MMLKTSLALLLALTLADPAAAQRVLTRADFGTPTKVLLAGVPWPSGGDFGYGFGLDIHKEADGKFYLVTSSWKPQYLIKFRLPDTFSGTATYVSNLGEMGTEGQLFGVFYDAENDRYCAHGHGMYDTDPRQSPTLTCVPIDRTTGKLRTVVNSRGVAVPAARKWIFADATKPCSTLTPAATDLTTNRLTFAGPHGWAKGRHVIPLATGGGLNRGTTYYSFPVSTTTITLHKVYAESTGSAPVNPVDLTAPITGELESCIPRGDRATGGGSARVPEALVKKLKGHYIAGFGGIDSIITSGNVSMGPAACSYDLPAQDFAGFVRCTPLAGHPYGPLSGANFANRDATYAQTFHWDDNPERGSDAVKKYGHGKWTPGDIINQDGAIIQVGDKAAFAVVANLEQGAIWYGSNPDGLWPVLRDSEPVVPLSTDLTTGTVTFPSTVDWPTGTMVQLVAAQSGLRGGSGFIVYFVRQVGPSQYQFFRSEAEAVSSVLGLTPSSTDVTNDRVVFAQPHGFVTQQKVRVETAGNGLAAQEYYVNAAYPTVASFHTAYADAAGTIQGQEQNKVDLTAPITARIIAPPLKLTAPLTTGVRVMSYASRRSGSKAALNADGARHALYLYDINDLADVGNGLKSMSAIQPKSYDNLELPGVTYPFPGLPGLTRMTTGSTWVPEPGRFAVSTRDTGPTKAGRWVWFYPVNAKRPFTFTATRTVTTTEGATRTVVPREAATRTITTTEAATVTVEATSEAEALALAKTQALSWTATGTVVSEPVRTVTGSVVSDPNWTPSGAVTSDPTFGVEPK